MTGERKPGDIGFALLRGGTVVGEHSAIFAGPAERVEPTDRAEDRPHLRPRALHAALWARGNKRGLYSMADVLDLATSRTVAMPPPVASNKHRLIAIYELIALGFAGLFGAHEISVPDENSDLTLPFILAAAGTACFVGAGLMACKPTKGGGWR